MTGLPYASVIYTTSDLVPLGAITRYIEVQALKSRNAPASVTVKAPALPEYIDLMQPGNRQVLVVDGRRIVGGPIEYPALIEWAADPTDAATGPGMITCASTSDLVWLANRLVYPDPAHSETAQTADSYVLTATNAEVAIRDLVNLNVGPGALAARQVPAVALGALAGVGSNVDVDEQWSTVLEACQRAALVGGDLNFDLVEDGGQLKLEVWEPEDLTATVWFSRGLNNLRKLSWMNQAPTVTTAIVGSSTGTGTARTIRSRTDAAAEALYGRIEKFVQGSSDDPATLDQDGDKALADGAEQAQVSATATDVNRVRYGVDYDLGDRVSVGIYDGLAIQDAVTGVAITLNQTGMVVTPQIGSTSARSDQAYVEEIRKLGLRMSRLERRGL